ncbi:hypothetical protein EDB19DRAFT_1692927 [Suillus lakei]|nr:hypothetical protein EDB19DRAFT_1692927 [Suillus lakei]
MAWVASIFHSLICQFIRSILQGAFDTLHSSLLLKRRVRFYPGTTMSINSGISLPVASSSVSQESFLLFIYQTSVHIPFLQY